MNMTAFARLLTAISLLSLSLCVAWGDNSPVKDIEAAYQRAALGARLKFVEGLLAHRTDDFAIYSAEGKKLDLSIERDRFRQLFQPANRVQLDTQILSAQELPNEVVCQVHQILRVETQNPQTHLLETNAVTTLTVDHWVQTPQGWRVKLCEVKQQTFGPAEPLAKDLGPRPFTSKKAP